MARHAVNSFDFLNLAARKVNEVHAAASARVAGDSGSGSGSGSGDGGNTPGFVDSILSDTNLVALIILVVVFVAIILLSVVFLILYWFFCLKRDVLYDEAKRNQRMAKKMKQTDEKEEQSRLNRPVRASQANAQELRGLVAGPLDAPPSSTVFLFHGVPPAAEPASAEAHSQQREIGASSTSIDPAVKNNVSEKGEMHGATLAQVVTASSSAAASTASTDEDDEAHTANLTNQWQVAFRHFLFYDPEGAWNTRIQHNMLRLPHDWSLCDPHNHPLLEKDKDRWASALARRRRLHLVLPGFFPDAAQNSSAVNFHPHPANQDVPLEASSTAAVFPTGGLRAPVVPPPLSGTQTQQQQQFTAFHAQPPPLATRLSVSSGTVNSTTMPPTATTSLNTPQSPARTVPESGYGFWPSFSSAQSHNPFAAIATTYPAPETSSDAPQRRLSQPQEGPAPAPDAAAFALPTQLQPSATTNRNAHFTGLPPLPSAPSDAATPTAAPPSAFKVNSAKT